MTKYRVIGLMSGTSLDGLDIACCEFENVGDKWNYSITNAKTIKYKSTLVKKIKEVETGSALELAQLDVDLGIYYGKETAGFIRENKLNGLDFIASHGQTIFHQPQKSLTLQIGSGAHIAAQTGLPVVCDFRKKDVALGGQGAPLVPIGDELLFNDYDFCLNLGGFANISFNRNKKRIAFDVCPVNIVLNELALKMGLKYDKDGKMAASGKVNAELLNQLNRLTFYKKKEPKSLGKEWVIEKFNPFLGKYEGYRLNDLMATVCDHIAIQISGSIKQSGLKGKSVFITGGGAFHKFLIERIKYHCEGYNIHIPSPEIINFKEALIFAFLGVLRWEGKVNCLKSVTGAKMDSIGGNLIS